jgi:hypothetical protein
MAIPFFKSFYSTVTPFLTGGQIIPRLRLLVDPRTGSPVGLRNPSDGPDGIWTPIDLTAAQIAAPTAAMLADLNATFRLNVAPYTRYQSTGTALVSLDGGSNINTNGIIYSPWTITDPVGVNVAAEVRVIAFPA